MISRGVAIITIYRLLSVALSIYLKPFLETPPIIEVDSTIRGQGWYTDKKCRDLQNGQQIPVCRATTSPAESEILKTELSKDFSQ